QKSEYAKRLENKKAKQLTQSQSGTMDNYVIKIPHVSFLNNEDVGGGDNNDEYIDEDGVNNTDVNNEDLDDVNNEDVHDVKLDYDDDVVLGLILIMIMLTRVTIEQSFIGFLNVDETTEKRFFDDELKSLDLDIEDVRSQVAKSDNDSLIQSQAKSLATKELGDIELLVAVVIWFEILYAINLVSRILQSNDMIMDIAIKEVKGLISFFEKFR
nr:zinc finger MYM-type protein 1 [Tanacetum cinerariifolium]